MITIPIYIGIQNPAYRFAVIFLRASIVMLFSFSIWNYYCGYSLQQTIVDDVS